MKDLFWKLFEKSGSVDAFLAYREYRDYEQTPTATAASDTKD